MDCPKCSRPLSRTTYENVRVMQCEECLGYLVVRKRLRLIKSLREQSPEALQSEADTQQVPDTQEQIGCPRCRVETMNKERVRIAADDFFHLDVCRKCDRVWLDGGELARLQIKFEQSAKAVEAFAHQERLRSFTDEQRAEFQERIDKLPRSESFLRVSAADFLFSVGGIALFLATSFSLFAGHPIWSGLFSLALCALLVYGFISRLDATSFQRLVGLGVVGVVETAFLVYLVWFY